MQAVVFSLGCKVNKCESNSIMASLNSLGFGVSDELLYADLYVINTCAVTNEAEAKSRQMLSRIKALNSDAKIIILGCASQNNSQKFMNDSNVIGVFGTFEKSKVIDFIKNYYSNKPCSKENFYLEEKIFNIMPTPMNLKTRANIKVQDGCNNFCSYCLIPYLRGRSRSRSPQSVIDEINSVDSLEVVLDGINLSSYNYEGINFEGLIKSLKGINKRIRIGSLEVGVITESFLLALKELQNFAPHFHLSLQSGSNKILKDMNRHYSVEEFYDKVKLIRKHFNNVAITTDVISGYPTETETDFIDTYNFIKNVNFSDIHPFTFSMRSGTKASKLKDLPKQIKKDRTKKLLVLKKELLNSFLVSNINRSLEVIGEVYSNGYTVGYAENYIKVYVLGNYVNQKYKVKVNALLNDGVEGSIKE